MSWTADVPPHTLMRHTFGKMLPFLSAAATFSLASNILVLASPLYSSQVFDRVLSSGHVETLFFLTVITGAAFMILSWIDSIRTHLLALLGTQLERKIAGPLLELGVQRSIAGSAYGTSSLRDLANIRGFVSGPAIGPIFDAPWTPMFLVALFLLHPALGIIALVSAIVLFALALVSEMCLNGPQSSANLHLVNTQVQSESMMRNSEVIRAMGMMESLLARWRVQQEAGLRAQEKAAYRASLLNGCSKFVRLFVQALIMGVGAYLVLKGQLTGGSLIAASMLLSRALTPVEQAINFWRQFTSARQSFSTIQKSLIELDRKTIPMQLPPPSGKVVLDNISFSARSSEGSILQSVSLKLEAGEAVGIVGPSGCGKSTLCKIITGILPASEGAVRLDGAEIGQWNVDTLGEHFGYLPQTVELFPGTIAENIARMRHADAGDVLQAAHRANVHDLIVKFPQGYETVVGDGGLPLSGGQRQRIGLARVLFGSPALVVLDEPNANLDAEGEAALMGVIRNLKSDGVTTIVVAHRQQILGDMDRIIIMNKGQIVHEERGASFFRRVSTRVSEVSASRVPKEMENAKAG